ncbi:MAG: hypothetical protein ABJ215_01945 [Alphaproteobacteria bacterium]
MKNLNTFQSDVEILRQAEHERGEAMVAFFRWLFAERNHDKPTEVSGDAVAAE